MSLTPISGFWELNQPADAPAAIDASTGRTWTYGQLQADVTHLRSALPPGRSLGLLLAHNRYNSLVAYIAALQSGCPLILIDPELHPELLQRAVDAYHPHWVHSAVSPLAGYLPYTEGLSLCEHPPQTELHPSLALLLNTSGSTGSPRLVRLSLGNLAANAAAIAQYLELSPQDRPITSLPMPYSYGLSVINSHLHVGAAIVFTEHGVLRREFWDAVDQHGCTSIAGVPYTYQLLLQTGLLTKKGATLKTLTQAGGRLEERLIQQMHTLALTRGWKFFVMYGQTEAAARISYVPVARLGEKVGSIGITIPNGSLTLDPETGELIYAGPNVMLGYADSSEDLALGDQLGGVLRTGDLARQDSDGFFYITGRLKRFIKVFGKRFNLDDVERTLATHIHQPLACFGRDDLLAIAIEAAPDLPAATDLVAKLFGLPRTAIQVSSLAQLPRNANGKLDYRTLESSLAK